MRSISPKREACISEARRLYDAGDKDAAWDVLAGDRYDHGIDERVDAELRRLFPIPREQVARLAAIQQQLDDSDAKARQQAARALSRFVLGTVSNDVFRFVQHAETMAFFVRNLGGPDPVVQEHLTICIARALDKYVHDDRAFEPLVRMSAAPKENTRVWAIQGLAALTDAFVPRAVVLFGDKAARVREAATDAMTFALANHGGGTLHRPALGPAGRLQLGEALASYDLGLPAKERAARAFLLAEVAEPVHLPVLEEWHRKDKSKEVRAHLQTGVDRFRTT